MKLYARLWKYLAEFFLEWETFQSKVADKIKIHFIISNFFPQNRAIH